MKEIFVVADNITSPLGTSTHENFSRLRENVSAVKQQMKIQLAEHSFYASLFDDDIDFLKQQNDYTKFEKLLIKSISGALSDSNINPSDKKTLLIISTTKGNVSLLEAAEYSDSLQKRIALHTSAKLVAQHFNFTNQPLVVSNACISGLLGIITAMRLINIGKYENVVVAGADVISKFVFSGFKSLRAMSNAVCKPFDKNRNGINLGEGAATVILSCNPEWQYKQNTIKVRGGAASNDANHISAPSKTGDELYYAIAASLKQAQLDANDIDFISAHGTATIFNDEMEAKAIASAGMQNVPLNSLKVFYGHTLGAAGLIESVVSIQSLKENIILPIKGFEEHGVSAPVTICDTLIQKPLKHCLKTAAGFGGCNAAVIFSKQ